jgi:hypothetical protein
LKTERKLKPPLLGRDSGRSCAAGPTTGAEVVAADDDDSDAVEEEGRKGRGE